MRKVCKIALVTVFVVSSLWVTVGYQSSEPQAEVIVEQKVLPVTPTKMYYDCPLDQLLQDHIRALCDKNNIPIDLVLAVIEQESSFRPDVISHNDYGLMQINKINHGWLYEKYGITDFLDPYKNVFCGITMLSGYYAKYQDVNKALMAYNIGEYGAKIMWEQGIVTTSYTEQVKAKRVKYETPSVSEIPKVTTKYQVDGE
jgi:hypothetical protein